MDQAGPERGPVEQRRGQHVQRVEPAADLAVVLDDEVARVVVLEPVGVLERVVHLGERHRPGLEPAVEHLGHPAHGGAPGRVVRVGAGELVDERAVQVGRAHAEVPLEVVERAVDVGARVGGVVGHPDRDGRAPEPVAADRPVAGVGQPLPERAVLDVVGHPGDVLVELDHAVLDRRDLDEPAADGAVDERVVAAPAVRVRVLVGLVADQQALLAQRARDGGVGLEDVLADEVADRLGELAAGVDRDDDLDARGVGDDLVLLAEGGRDVDDAGAVLGGDVVRRQHDVGVRVAGEVVEGRGVAAAEQVGAGEALDDLGVLPQLAGVRGRPGPRPARAARRPSRPRWAGRRRSRSPG